MEDRLRDVLAASLSRQTIDPRESPGGIELISIKELEGEAADSMVLQDLSFERIRSFQRRVERFFGVKLIVVGGGFGCTKINFDIETSIKEDKKEILIQLIQDSDFRKIALKYGFSFGILKDTQIVADFKSGMIAGPSDNQGLLLYCSYSHYDEKYRRQLEKHLSALNRIGLIRIWHDRKIMPGVDWQMEIDSHLESSDIILLLISADFIESQYCYSLELETAISRHDNGRSRVIPILIRFVDWEGTPFSKLQIIPRGNRPIEAWRSRDKGWTEVAKEIRRAVYEISANRSNSIKVSSI
jgi:hypothetical protein